MKRTVWWGAVVAGGSAWAWQGLSFPWCRAAGLAQSDERPAWARPLAERGDGVHSAARQSLLGEKSRAVPGGGALRGGGEGGANRRAGGRAETAWGASRLACCALRDEQVGPCLCRSDKRKPDYKQRGCFVRFERERGWLSLWGWVGVHCKEDPRRPRQQGAPRQPGLVRVRECARTFIHKRALCSGLACGWPCLWLALRAAGRPRPGSSGWRTLAKGSRGTWGRCDARAMQGGPIAAQGARCGSGVAHLPPVRAAAAWLSRYWLRPDGAGDAGCAGV